MQTAETILQVFEKRVANNEPISPSQFLDYAIRINALTGDLDNQIAHYKVLMNNLEAELLAQDIPATKAKVLARSKMDYEAYLRLEALRFRIEEFMSLARNRSKLTDYGV